MSEKLKLDSLKFFENSFEKGISNFRKKSIIAYNILRTNCCNLII